MDRLHAKVWITNPRGKQESIHLTTEGLSVAKQRAAEKFGVSESGLNVR